MESVDNKFHFSVNRAAYDFSDARGGELVDKFRLEEEREVAVHPFVAGGQPALTLEGVSGRARNRGRTSRDDGCPLFRAAN